MAQSSIAQSSMARSQVPPQRKHRIQPHRPPNRRRAPRERHYHRNRQNHRQQHRRNRNFGIKDRMPNLMSQHTADHKSHQHRQSRPAASPRQRRSTPPQAFPRPAPSSAQLRRAVRKWPSPSPPKPPAPTANRAASVIRKISPSMRVSTAPSFCETCRICSACECGIASAS